MVAPLSHKNCAMDEVRTVFSTKLLEYLVSGRPIIVFAPEDSYHAISASKHGWGYAVTEDSPVALAAAIEKVVRDENLAARLVHGALQEARSRSATRHAGRLLEWVLSDTEDHSNKASAKITITVSDLGSRFSLCESVSRMNGFRISHRGGAEDTEKIVLDKEILRTLRTRCVSVANDEFGYISPPRREGRGEDSYERTHGEDYRGGH